jgi:hypothetical protein
LVVKAAIPDTSRTWRHKKTPRILPKNQEERCKPLLPWVKIRLSFFTSPGASGKIASSADDPRLPGILFS